MEYVQPIEGVLIKKTSVEGIQKANVIIFDCDGVLVDVTQSYIEAIKKTVNFFFSDIFCFEKVESDSLINNVDIQKLRNTGGLNNDWELTYTTLLFYLAHILASAEKLDENSYLNELIEMIEKSYSFRETIEILGKIGNYVKPNIDATLLLNKKFDKNCSFNDYISSLDLSGSSSGEKFIEEVFGKKMLKKINRMIQFKKEIENNLIMWIFEEIYLGKELFSEIYGLDPLYNFDGLIQSEKLLLTQDDLEKLISKYDIKKLGICSGRPGKQAIRVIAPIIKYFNKDLLTFLEVVEEEEERQEKLYGKQINLGKPNPFSLVYTLSRIKEPYNTCLYVGDTVSDILMAKNAPENLKVLSVGVLGSNQNETLSKFKELETDLILYDTKMLLDVFEKIKGG